MSTVSTPSRDTSDPLEENIVQCQSCKKRFHLPVPDDDSDDGWKCSDCALFDYSVDKILAWRPCPPGALQPSSPDIKSALPREYLVKWVERSFRRVQWVPHTWLVSTNYPKLNQFLAKGPRVDLLEEPLTDADAVYADGSVETDAATKVRRSPKPESSSPGPLEDAELRIPPAWKKIDRILDVQLWNPPHQSKPKPARRAKRIIVSDDEAEDRLPRGLQAQLDRAFEDGEQPDDQLLESVDEWQARTKETLGATHIDRVVWAYIKWQDLDYEEATWDSPPRRGESGYHAFEKAFQAFLESRMVFVSKSRKEIQQLEDRPPDGYAQYVINPETEDQPDLGQSSQLKLMKFQIDGFNWLCDNWWIRQPCILADEMGLGKTVQITAFLGTVIGKFKAAPALVVVPNSTITNWVREFSRWAPRLRVVPFHGRARSRDVIIEYELFHPSKKKNTKRQPKYHVLITTYETVNNNRDFNLVFKDIPRWEVLVVDEGQRLKSDSSLLFRRLNELKVIHRVIMTGTPLNNNIRELFNLMNFLDSDQWKDLEALAREYEVLDEESVRQLHTRLKPYFLRRLKSDVLQLPPKNEVIVPLSMTPLQKEIYRSILSQNLDILKSLTQVSSTATGRSPALKTNMNNILMQLRKCLQHPYLISDTIEPRGLSTTETHERLISASAKLRFLKALLPKLKTRGHRVLLFSQFVLVLDIVEDFLTGEGYKFLRLDGETNQSDRQKNMDKFNEPDSDVFIYILTTRAGGVGINLYTADTVVIFDADFNPHQDLQAISRSHRYGQQKTCLVFKLMVKDSAEERIMQAGKKKLVLDHLIVQKMDDEENGGDDLQSILTFGAKVLFKEGDQSSSDIVYTDNDLDKLIEKTEIEGDEQDVAKEPSLRFSFAKVWAADKDTFEDLGEEVEDITQNDSWTQALERIAATKDGAREEQEATGRGVRRRAAALFPQQQLSFLDGVDESPEKTKSKKRKRKQRSSKSGTSSDSDEYAASLPADDTDMSMETIETEPISFSEPKKRDTYRENMIMFVPQALEEDVQKCGLCDSVHGIGACKMINDSANLVMYRNMLLDSKHEPGYIRKAAIKAIEKELRRREWRTSVDQSQGAKPMLKKVSGPAPPQPDVRAWRHYRMPTQVGGHPPPPAVLALPEPLPNPVPTALVLPALLQTTRNDDSQGADRIPRVLPDPPSHPIPPKQASSSLRQEAPPLKKQKQNGSLGCPVCLGPHHLIKDCPAVAEGAGRVAMEIERLSGDPGNAQTVTVLRRFQQRLQATK